MVNRSLATAPVLAACLLLLAASPGRAECRSVHYETGQNYIGTHSSQGLATISVEPGDVTVDNLLCLAQGLHATYPEWRDVIVLFFASREAATGWKAGWQLMEFKGATPPFRKWEKEMRAGYFLGIEQREEYLLLMPFGWNSRSDEMSTRIDLPIRVPRNCRVALASRCLMAWDQFDYPSDPGAEAISGSVNVEGRVGRDGAVTSVRSTDGGAFPSTTAKLIANAAVKQIKSWRFEPSTREDQFRITYWYTPESSLLPGTTRVDVEFPDRVRITGNPPAAP
jgi:TonB family protein